MRVSARTFLAASAAALAAAATAQGGTGWHGIGQAVAPADAATVTIPAQGDPRDREIMFCVEGHAMRLNQGTLHFQGGGTQQVRIGERLADGGCSAGKSLSGHNHAVESAEVTYDRAILAGGTARVQLFVR